MHAPKQQKSPKASKPLKKKRVGSGFVQFGRKKRAIVDLFIDQDSESFKFVEQAKKTGREVDASNISDEAFLALFQRKI